MKSFYFTMCIVFAAISLKAARADDIDYTPKLYFEESCPGSYVVKNIVIKNMGSETVKILRNPVISGPDAAFFSIINNPLINNDIDLPTFINDENALNLTVKFKYVKGDTTLKTAQLTIQTNGITPPALVIDLSGSSTNTLYTFNPYNIDLGSIQAGKTYRDTVNFTNMGYEPVRLDSVLLGNQKLNFYVRNLNAGDTAQIPLEFNFPSTGEVFSSIRIFMNSMCADTMVIPFHAKADGSIYSILDNVNFGDTLICGSKTLPVFIKPGAAPLTIKSVSQITGPNASVFAIVSIPSMPFVVPNTGYSLNVLYNPAVDAKFGQQNAEFTVSVDDGSGTIIDNKISLSGFVWKDSLVANPVDFGDIWVGIPNSLPISIGNRPKYPVVIDSVALLSGKRGFTLNAEPLKSQLLNPGASVSSTVDFMSLQQGSFKDTARIYFSLLDCKFTRDVTITGKAHGATTLSFIAKSESEIIDPKKDDFSVSVLATSPIDSVIAANYSLDSIVVSIPSQLLHFKGMSIGKTEQAVRNQERWRITIIPEKPTTTDTTVIAKLNCTPLLGAVTSDSVFIEKVSFTDKLSSITINKTGARLDLIYCERGGARLLNNARINPEATQYIRSLDGEIGVKFRATEIGAHTLRAYDLTGRVIAAREFNCDERGRTFDFMLDELPAGFYFIEISAPSQSFTLKAMKTGF